MIPSTDKARVQSLLTKVHEGTFHMALADSGLLGDSRVGVPTRYIENRLGRSELQFSDGFKVVREGLKNPYLVSDSGQVSHFQPAQYSKPQAQGLIHRITNAWSAMLGKPSFTTEQGASAAASPVTYYMTLWEQRFGRRAMIEDCRTLYLSDSRIYRSVNMACTEATRGDFSIEILGDNRQAKKAREVAKAVKKLLPRTLTTKWLRSILLEGDLFTQNILDNNERLVKVKRMPSMAIERLTNDADEFIDPFWAFAQIDSMTFEGVSMFAEPFMHHARWGIMDGDRYGIPDIVSIRRNVRLLGLLEQSQGIRRMVRAPLRRLHLVGAKDAVVGEKELTDYKNRNGFVEGQQEIFDPTSAGRDYFSNGLADIKNLDGDGNIDKIDDLLHFQNVMQAGLSTPGVFFGLDADRLNRDIVEALTGLWLKGLITMTDTLSEVIDHVFKLALLIAEVLPEKLEYQILWGVSSLESPTQRVTWITDLLDYKLITRKKAVMTLNDLLHVTDIDSELDAAWKEAEEDLDLQSEYAKPMQLSAIPAASGQKRKAAIANNTKTSGQMKKTVLPEK